MKKRLTKPKNVVPRFKSEDQEREFWDKHEVVDYFNWELAAQPTHSALKPSTTAISIRLPNSMLEELKLLASKQDVPYQSLMKVYLAQRLDHERRNKAG
jgi:predicted DNA binding CopG/RHH family protein